MKKLLPALATGCHTSTTEKVTPSWVVSRSAQLQGQ